MVRLRVLGSLEAYVDGARVGLGGPRQRAVLAMLLCARGGVVSVDRMIDQLWEGSPPTRALVSLQGVVESPPQPVHIRTDRTHRRRGRSRTPQRVDQFADPHLGALGDQQRPQHGPLLRRSEVHLGRAAPRADRPQHREPNLLPHLYVSPCRNLDPAQPPHTVLECT
ncbi:hypothetical protein ACIGMX_05475 [Streptomyces aquilus]|uniref:hypothetical protein n=1 Tax=Streptomyces aquilus TaxID=2548456 RepID=UPI0037D2035B